MSRPTKLTPELEKKVCDAIRDGNYFSTSCRSAGIAPETGLDWMHRGESEQPRRAKKAIYVEFALAVRVAEAECEVRMVEKWRTAMPGDWRAIQMFLERRFPEQWGRREKQEISGEKGGPVVIEVRYVDIDSREQNNH